MNGDLQPLEGYQTLTGAEVQRVMYAVMTQAQRERFEEDLELDFSYAIPGVSRFRVNTYRQKDNIGAAFRVIPMDIKPLQRTRGAAVVANFASLPRGFVLVTGPTGSGKSTTLAALIDLASRSRHDHIMTVEDPIEFPARSQALPGQSARSRHRHVVIRSGAQARAAAGPGHHPGRRDARLGDDPGGADCG